MGASTAEYFVNDDDEVLDEDSTGNPTMEPDNFGGSRILLSAPGSVSIFNNLDTEEDQEVEGDLGSSSVSNYQRIALDQYEALAPRRSARRPSTYDGEDDPINVRGVPTTFQQIAAGRRMATGRNQAEGNSPTMGGQSTMTRVDLKDPIEPYDSPPYSGRPRRLPSGGDDTKVARLTEQSKPPRGSSITQDKTRGAATRTSPLDDDDLFEFADNRGAMRSFNDSP